MKKTIVAIAVLCAAAVWAAEQKAKPEAAVLPASAYRTPLDEIVVEGKMPYWHREAPPRWEKPKVEAPTPGEATPGRLQWAPKYTRDEREDFNEVRDQMNPKARMKLFEIRF